MHCNQKTNGENVGMYFTKRQNNLSFTTLTKHDCQSPLAFMNRILFANPFFYNRIRFLYFTFSAVYIPFTTLMVAQLHFNLN